MSSFKSRFQVARAKLLRRPSHASSTTSQCSSVGSEAPPRTGSSLRKSMSLSKLAEVSDATTPDDQLSRSEVLPGVAAAGSVTRRPETGSSRDRQSQETFLRNARLKSGDAHEAVSSSTTSLPQHVRTACPTVTIQEPTPVHPPFQPPPPNLKQLQNQHQQPHPIDGAASTDSSEDPAFEASKPTSSGLVRRQSLVAPSNAGAINTLLAPDDVAAAAPATTATAPPPANDYFAVPANFNAGMLHRKIWVKRQSGSATLVQIREDDLVDDVREMILKKYGNSLGRSFDAPDLTLRIIPRDTTGKGQERALGPEEDMCRTLDAYFPGGQTVHEALIIDIPRTRTPKPSPRVPQYYSHHDDSQSHHQTEYFPLMPITNPSPATVAHDPRATLVHAPHSIAVLQTGQLPSLPSPGGTRRIHANRPKYPRHNTASPTAMSGGGLTQPAPTSRPPPRARHDSSASEKHSVNGNPPPIPTPPVPVDPNVRNTSTPPTPRVSSPKPEKKRKKQKQIEPPSLPPGLLDNSVPPINVLIVEDNIINLRVLGAFMQRLKVRWQRAMNGKEAIEKWRAGGFHLVLMDIQLPIMDGLEATREIRRLERVNSIGVFSSGSSEAPNNRLGDQGVERELEEDDKLGDSSLFKSPVIIVALTASSLQSDRHEALAAGCNDFLTKPVNFVWLERKVKEWGCMQALIDFDGWRKWKDFTNASDTADSTSKLSTSYSSVAPRKGKAAANSTATSNSANGAAVANGAITKPKDENEKKSKRKSMTVVPPPVLPEEEGTTTPDIDSGDT